MKEIKKLMPQIKQQVTQAVEVAQKSMEQIDMKKASNKIQQAIQLVKRKIDNLKKSSKNNEVSIKVNNKEAEKQISQIQKQIDSLQEKINSRQMKLNLITPRLDKITSDTTKAVTPDGISSNNPAIQKTINNSLNSNKEYTTLLAQEEKLVQEIQAYNRQLDEAKTKMSELSRQTEETATTQNKLSSFFSAFKNKIDQTKPSINSMKAQFTQMPKITQKVTNNIKNMGAGLKSGLRHVIKYAGALLSIRGIYGLLRSTASAWLSSQNAGAKQLSANIDYMKYAMGSALAPVIQFVINLVYQLMKAIQSVAYALTGVNIFANASAKSYANMANSAKKARKETNKLADIDEIHNIQKDSDSGDNGNENVAPSFDLSQMNPSNSILDAIKKGNWHEIGVTVGQKINEAMEKIDWTKIRQKAKDAGKNIAEFLNGAIETINWKEVGNMFAQGINTVIDFGYEFVTTFNWLEFGISIAESINSFFSNIDWKKMGQTLSEGIQGVLWSLIAFLAEIDWFAIGSSIGEFLASIDWITILGQLLIVLCEAVYAVIMAVAGFALEILKGIGQWLNTNLLQPSMEIFKELFRGIQNIFSGIGQWFTDRFNEAVEGIKNVFASIGGFFSGIWEGICKTFGHVSEWFKDKFSKAWQAVKNVFSSGGKIFDGIKDGILSGLKTVINAIIRGINRVVAIPFNGINTALRALRGLDLWGWRPFSWIGQINVPQIPTLAKGGVLYDDTLVRVGEYTGASNNPEIVTPQNIMYDTMKKALQDVGTNNNLSIQGEAELKINGKSLARTTIFDFNNEAQRLGYRPILQRG